MSGNSLYYMNRKASLKFFFYNFSTHDIENIWCSEISSQQIVNCRGVELSWRSYKGFFYGTLWNPTGPYETLRSLRFWMSTPRTSFNFTFGFFIFFISTLIKISDKPEQLEKWNCDVVCKVDLGYKKHMVKCKWDSHKAFYVDFSSVI